jgi:hypothetical protein
VSAGALPPCFVTIVTCPRGAQWFLVAVVPLLTASALARVTTPVMLDARGVDLLDSRCTPANVLHVFRWRAWVRRKEGVDPLRDV